MSVRFIANKFFPQYLLSPTKWSSLGSYRTISKDVAPTQTVQDVIVKLSALVGASASYKGATVDRMQLLKLLPKSQDELPLRKMMDSYDSAVIPLSQSQRLREKYMTYKGGVRVGRLLEDLDVFAVWLCYKHIENPHQQPDLPSPYTVVTAMVDRMDFCKGAELDPNKDIRVGGHVSWVGKSSMEAMLKVDQLQDGVWNEVTNAVFVMVARDPLNQGSAIVNKLVPETKEEDRIFHQGVVNSIARKQIQKESLFVMPPSEKEKSIVHDIFMSMADPENQSFAPKTLPPGSKSMAETKLKNLIICHPEHRNRFRKIYGGFIMRQATENAWNCASVYSGQRATIRHIDDISFRKPVEIGSLLYLNSQVSYTEGNNMQVSTKASMMDPVTQQLVLTNIFHFTYAADVAVPRVLPRSYHEAMMYLDGRRHYQLVKGNRRYYGQSESKEEA